ncbi:hypothetical protein A3F00_03425 [Candidatus Daviesbacteria bacterium RIFCSPHIGHO2_12_FULL_37_11]|uniref:M23ase beta-sheet core domain-containing protein n=1 Tax=Candidatus Daviesbacteria bacterium RIFCSPHIGHO2_12_FULL_37_11 TaxID=1797777 RepID=A0A1F5KCL8_9BACT|nr:MAG: hypothetical protein A3F00_03425 [Candidatus Daviesbacteria bacterium RIFCSPHIGHO2_12_FULL_37_11]
MTSEEISGIISPCLFNILQKSLLSKKFQRGVALNSEDSNIKPRLIPDFARDPKRLKNTGQKYLILALIALSFLGYQPSIQFPHVKQSISFAQEDQTQTIKSDTLPQLQLPHPGYLSTRFSRFHPGVDIATGLGMPIHPVTEGEVAEVNYGIFGYGNHVIIVHAYGLKSLYGHMGRVYAVKGQTVSTEDTLGTVGMTGFTSGPHTHLEIIRNGTPMNPQTLLPPLQNYPSEEYLKPYGGNVEIKNLSKSLKPDFN